MSVLCHFSWLKIDCNCLTNRTITAILNGRNQIFSYSDETHLGAEDIQYRVWTQVFINVKTRRRWFITWVTKTRIDWNIIGKLSDTTSQISKFCIIRWVGSITGGYSDFNYEIMTFLLWKLGKNYLSYIKFMKKDIFLWWNWKFC